VGCTYSISLQIERIRYAVEFVHPTRSRQHAAECSQKRPIRGRQLRTSYLALQHAQLMTKQQDLDLLLPFGATAEHRQFQQPPQRPVKKRQNDTLRAARHGRRPYRSGAELTRQSDSRCNRVFGTHTPSQGKLSRWSHKPIPVWPGSPLARKCASAAPIGGGYASERTPPGSHSRRASSHLLMAALALESSAFEHAQPVPSRYTCDGDDVSPPLRWANLPEEARSLALLVDDPDAPRGVFTHWLAWGLDPGRGGLGEGEAAPRRGAKRLRNGRLPRTLPTAGTRAASLLLSPLRARLRSRARSGCGKARAGAGNRGARASGGRARRYLRAVAELA
jgi:Phosphatidylethanolamine-binding protein